MGHATLEAVRRKQLIFTVTAGRTGTNYLAHLLACVPGVAAYHEPDPSYRRLMRAAVRDPGLARAFLLELKLPSIAAAPGSIYAETSHMFCKGFFVPLLQLGLRPGLVFLRRPPREVAHSLLQHDMVPARTPLGNAYMFHPDDLNVLPIPRWKRLTDYQLCFWYALAIERRQLRYAEFALTLGLPIFDASAVELNDFARFAALLDTFGLSHGPELEGEHARIGALRHNANVNRRTVAADVEAQEAEVWKRVAGVEPSLRSLVAQRYGDWSADFGLTGGRAA